jgi:hypothetical protein
MHLFDELNEKNYVLFAIRHYDNPSAVTREDFYDDLKRFKYVKRLLKRYQRGGELKTHLVINHIIVLYNVFGESATPLMFFKLDNSLWNTTKSFLMFLNKLPEFPKTKLHDIQPDINALSILQKEYYGTGKN